MIEGGIKKGLGGYLMPVGNIKIGKKGEEKKARNSDKKWRQPIRLDHFIITTTERGEDGNFLIDEAVMESIGEKKPKSIRVRFPFDKPTLIFQTSFQMYDGKQLKCEGNGEIAERKDKEGKMTEGKCMGRECQYMIDKKCKPSGRLACHLPDSPHYGGIYMYRTHGWNSVNGIMAALENYHAQTGQILQGLPFRLIFTNKATEEHGNVPVVVLVMDGIELSAMRALARAEKQDRIEFKIVMEQVEKDAVLSGVLDDTDEPEDIAEEFYPETEDEEPDEAGASAEDVQDALTEKAETEAPGKPVAGTKPDLF